MERRFKELELSLQDITNGTSTGLRIPASEFTRMKNSSAASGIMYPAVNRVNRLSTVMSEDELVDFVTTNLINRNGIAVSRPTYDVMKLVSRLPYFPQDSTIPEFQAREGSQERRNVNRYVDGLAGYSYLGRPELQLQVNEILQLMIDNKSEYFTLDTYRSLIKFYAMQYKFDSVMELFELMDGFGLPRDIRCHNVAIYESMKTGNRYRIRQTARICKDLIDSRGGLEPDLLTVNAIAAGLREKHSMVKMVGLMDERRIPYYFTRTFFSRMKIGYPARLEDIDAREFTASEFIPILNLWLSDEVGKDLVKAYKAFDAYERKRELAPSAKTFDLVFNELVDTLQNFTYAVAFYHFFREKDVELKEWEIYGHLIESLIHLGSSTGVDRSPNWDKTVRYLYMKSIDPTTGLSTVRPEIVESLNLVALKRGIFNFNVRNRPTVGEVEELEAQLSKLIWKEGTPTWKFEENHLGFRQASYYFGWTSDILEKEPRKPNDGPKHLDVRKRQRLEKQPIREDKHRHHAMKDPFGKAPKPVRELIEKVESEGLIDNAEYDTWIAGLYATRGAVKA
ncbi:DEKNAAC100303 [Brettanomyces naardenensis]|uniref:DEKNAAC100303 n=1 Tax=Brettanomyces naardenensis TaxID=13370 RepID=A0A448YGB4_BRENA|nr:DEKNAAC100303 [Brettanomyces naardenensis]